MRTSHPKVVPRIPSGKPRHSARPLSGIIPATTSPSAHVHDANSFPCSGPLHVPNAEAAGSTVLPVTLPDPMLSESLRWSTSGAGCGETCFPCSHVRRRFGMRCS